MIGKLHRQLKKATASIHSQLDAQSVLSDLVSPELTAERYQNIMWQQWLAYHHWQQQLNYTFAKLQLDEGWRIDLGLDNLRWDCPDSQVSSKKFDMTIPASLVINQPGNYLGHAYVFEGARLGGRFILKALQKREAQLGIACFHYYEAMAERSLTAWPEWMLQLEDYAVKNNIAFDDVVIGASHCFESVYDWFNQVRVTAYKPRQQAVF